MKRAVVRLPPDQITRLDTLARRLRVAHPGRSCSRATVVRALVAGELASVEQDGDRFADLARRVLPPREPKKRRP